MADDYDENTTVNADPINDNDDTPTTECQPNVNETTGFLQFNEIEKKEFEESMTAAREHDIFNSNVIILGSIPPKDTQNCEQRPKRRKPNELEALGVTEVKDQFDSFSDDTNKIYRKYRLRNVSKPDYRIPTMSDLPKPESSKSIKTETHACPDPECAKVFSTTIKLNVHLRLEHNVKFKCSLCSKTFDTNAKLVSHKSVHEDESRSYVCHGCKLAFSDHCDYLIHEFTHSKFRSKFECPECGLISLFRSAIQRHVQKHFDKKQTCPICFEEIQTSKLPSHVGLHNSNRECVECGKRLLGKKQFDEHMTVHTGVKIHQCLYCGKGFGTKNQKAVHTRIHTNERLYSCKYCCRKFIQITDMKRHQAGHDKIRNIECQICKKKFIRAIDLQCHMKTHTKKYSCPECGKRFSVIVSLKLHLLQVHSSERPVECKPCGKRFASEHHYREHTTSKIHKRNLFKETKDS